MSDSPSPIGLSPRRREDEPLLTGRGRYVEDLRRDGLSFVGFARSPHAHAAIRGIDPAEALAAPGVLAVWTAADLGRVSSPFGPAHGVSRRYTQPLLAQDVARYVGEAVALVVADDPYRLADALDRVVVDYEPRPAVPGPEAGLDAPPLHPDWPDNVAVTVAGAVGDAASALAGAEVVVEAHLRHPRLSGMAIETRGVLAYPDADGLLTVWSAGQNPYLIRDAVAVALDRPVESVRVLMPDVGGGFGPKGSVYAEEVLVAAVAQALGRPARWVESRREHLATTGHDREQSHQARIGFRADGTIVGIENRFLADVGAYPAEGDGLTRNTVNHLPGPYRVPHYRSSGRSVCTTKVQNAAYRGAGRPEAVFVMERLMDLGARRLGLDPAELRRRNMVQPAEMPYRPGLSYKDGVPIAYDPADYPAMFSRALQLTGYEETRRRQAARRAAGDRLRLGIGLACYAQGSGLGPCEGATVRVDPTGRVYVYVGVTAQGQGHRTTLAQVCAAELGVRVEDVEVVAGDTRVHPFGMGTGGSRVMANAGPAVAHTAREVRSRAEQVAADLLECAPGDVRIEAGRAFVAGVPSRAVPLGQVARAAVKSRVARTAGEPGLSTCTYFYPETVTWAFGTQVAVVEVDLDTCVSRLLRYVVVHDAGRPVHPVIVEAQLHGGATQGLAAGLLEEVVYDGDGQLLTGSFMDYAIPKADDLPSVEEFRVGVAGFPSVVNDLGVKGVGESGAIPGAAAVANAIEDAVADLGVVVTEVPVTPARLFALLQAASPR